MSNTKKTARETEKSQKSLENQGARQESVWEWIVAALGALLVVGTLAFLLYDSVIGTSPPNITVQVTGVQSSGDRYLVQFEAINFGGEGASNVTIQGTLRGAEEQPETANTTISYIAAGSKRAGGLYFSRDPNAFDLELVASGYEKP